MRCDKISLRLLVEKVFDHRLLDSLPNLPPRSRGRAYPRPCCRRRRRCPRWSRSPTWWGWPGRSSSSAGVAHLRTLWSCLQKHNLLFCLDNQNSFHALPRWLSWLTIVNPGTPRSDKYRRNVRSSSLFPLDTRWCHSVNRVWEQKLI